MVILSSGSSCAEYTGTARPSWKHTSGFVFEHVRPKGEGRGRKGERTDGARRREGRVEREREGGREGWGDGERERDGQ